MDLNQLEKAVRSIVEQRGDVLEALMNRNSIGEELAMAASGLVGRDLGPTAPDDPTKPWI